MPRRLIELFVRDDGFTCKASDGDRHYMKPTKESKRVRASSMGTPKVINLRPGPHYDSSVAYRAIRRGAPPNANAYSIGYLGRGSLISGSGEYPVQFFRIPNNK